MVSCFDITSCAFVYSFSYCVRVQLPIHLFVNHSGNDLVVFGGGHAATIALRATKKGLVKPSAIAAITPTWAGPLPIVFGRSSNMESRYWSYECDLSSHQFADGSFWQLSGFEAVSSTQIIDTDNICCSLSSITARQAISPLFGQSLNLYLFSLGWLIWFYLCKCIRQFGTRLFGVPVPESHTSDSANQET